ncbi:hypothetical protein PJ985_19895 [Streptomyces sp. ACA25]|uniref:hypothetical protein n=1 Tax=Streptomyces sp. ACA25 TaxID=3022596 RepID=UPI00230761D0|nr:hypothetical protein [Streptomyces sp. ACA25]MDB1089823.1 hypothetical protein [Streptomyces sp. ACA25]
MNENRARKAQDPRADESIWPSGRSRPEPAPHPAPDSARDPGQHAPETGTGPALPEQPGPEEAGAPGREAPGTAPAGDTDSATASAAASPDSTDTLPAGRQDGLAGTLPLEAASGPAESEEVLRFGPGVPAAEAGPAAPIAPASTAVGRPAGDRGEHRSSLRRYSLAAAVLLCVLAYLAWQQLGPELAVREVTVTTASGQPACDGTAEVIGVVGTNGQPGSVSYRWLRSDGTSSGTLEETFARGQRSAELRLRWTFRGRGTYAAAAELEILSPGQRTADVRFTYSCP